MQNGDNRNKFCGALKQPAECEDISPQKYLRFNGWFEIRARQRPLIYSQEKAGKNILLAFFYFYSTKM